MLTFSEAKARSMSNIFFNLYIIDTTHIDKKPPKWITEIAKQNYFFRVVLITDDTPLSELNEIFSDHLYAAITHEQAELSLSQIIDNVWQSILTRNYDKKEVS
jgi:disulfide oxidoreductase YuzD